MQTADDEPVVHLSGRVDAATASVVRAQLDAAIAVSTRDVIVDFTAVELVDATGLGVLVGAHHKIAKRGHRLVLRGCCPQLRRALAVTGLGRVMQVEPISAA